MSVDQAYRRYSGASESAERDADDRCSELEAIAHRGLLLDNVIVHPAPRVFDHADALRRTRRLMLLDVVPHDPMWRHDKELCRFHIAKIRKERDA